MQSLKFFGLAVAAAAAMLAMAASASATTVTTTTGGAAATPTFHLVNEGGHVSIHNPSANIECTSTIEGKVESHGAGVTVKARVIWIKLEACTNGWQVSTVNPGEFTVHWTKGHDGKITSDNGKLKATLNLGIFGHVTCNYATNETDIGTITGGNPATLHLEGKLPLDAGSSGLCGSEAANWTGRYVTTSALYVAP